MLKLGIAAAVAGFALTITVANSIMRETPPPPPHWWMQLERLYQTVPRNDDILLEQIVEVCRTDRDCHEESGGINLMYAYARDELNKAHWTYLRTGPSAEADSAYATAVSRVNAASTQWSAFIKAHAHK